jgi:hypothetical protein
VGYINVRVNTVKVMRSTVLLKTNGSSRQSEKSSTGVGNLKIHHHVQKNTHYIRT